MAYELGKGYSSKGLLMGLAIFCGTALQAVDELC